MYLCSPNFAWFAYFDRFYLFYTVHSRTGNHCTHLDAYSFTDLPGHYFTLFFCFCRQFFTLTICRGNVYLGGCLFARSLGIYIFNYLTVVGCLFFCYCMNEWTNVWRYCYCYSVAVCLSVADFFTGTIINWILSTKKKHAHCLLVPHNYNLIADRWGRVCVCRYGRCFSLSLMLFVLVFDFIYYDYDRNAYRLFIMYTEFHICGEKWRLYACVCERERQKSTWKRGWRIFYFPKYGKNRNTTISQLF